MRSVHYLWNELVSALLGLVILIILHMKCIFHICTRMALSGGCLMPPHTHTQLYVHWCVCECVYDDFGHIAVAIRKSNKPIDTKIKCPTKSIVVELKSGNQHPSCHPIEMHWNRLCHNFNDKSRRTDARLAFGWLKKAAKCSQCPAFIWFSFSCSVPFSHIL